MKYFAGIYLLLACAFQLGAQVIPHTQERQTIFDELQSYRAGKGSVIIDQSPGIHNLVGSHLFGDIETNPDGTQYLKFQGYRVQVYSGNDQRASKDEAFKREKELKEVAPGLSTYVTYNAPFWRLRVGDFSSNEEAYFVQRQLTQQFPKFGKEMYIVREDIKLSINDTF
jgi:hypothetical protein